MAMAWLHGVRTWLRAGFGAALAAATMIAGPALAQEEVKIGGLMDVTGPIANFMPALLASAQLAVDEVNAGGGILGGKKLRMVIVDTQGNEQGAVDGARKLVSIENVPIIVGPLISGTVIPAAGSVTIAAGVPLIAPTATSPAITTMKKNDMLFRIVPSDTYQGKVLARMVLDKGLKRVALSYANNDYGVGIAEVFRAAYVAGGGTLVADQIHETKKASYRAELATLAAGKPQALVLIAYAGDSGLTIVKQSLENNFFDTFIGTESIRDNLMIKQLGAANLKNFYGTAPTSPSDTTAHKKFDDAFSKANPSMTNRTFVEQVYDATLMAALAIEKAGSLDRNAVRDGLRSIAGPDGTKIEPTEWKKAVDAIKAGQKIAYIGAAGPHVFDANGDVTGYIGEWVVKGDEFTEVKIYPPM
jgi:branched-chain amino acid transport system substrate-binding protein